MCGIFGFVNKTKSNINPPAPITEAFKDLVFFNLPRGQDALGFMKLPILQKPFGKPKYEASVWKENGKPLKLLDTQPAKDMVQWCGDNHFIVGHLRSATKGEKGILGAHPFVAKKENPEHSIVLVHNGTLSTIKGEKELKAYTDSHACAKLLAQGMSIDELYRNVWGALALVWYDSEDYTMNFFRNGERPFGFCQSKEALWFGSETYLVGAAMDRHGITVTEFEKLPILEHWKINLNEPKEIIKRRIDTSTGKSINVPSHAGDVDWCAWEDTLSKDIEDQLREDSKSERDDAQTSVIPYSPSQTSTVVGPLPAPRVHQFLPKIPAKDRWTVVKDALGFSRNDAVYFSVEDYRAGSKTRKSQTLLYGHLVVFDNQRSPVLRPAIEIEGMVGANIADIDTKMRRDTVFLHKGIITDIFQQEVGYKAHKYKFHLKSIEEETSLEDTFCALKKVSATVIPLENPIKPMVHKAGFCCDCGQPFDLDKLHKVTSVCQGEDAEEANFCRDCFEAIICDDTRMWRILDQMKLLFDENKSQVAH